MVKGIIEHTQDMNSEVTMLRILLGAIVRQLGGSITVSGTEMHAMSAEQIEILHYPDPYYVKVEVKDE